MSEKKFIEELKKIGINPTKKQLKQLEEYYYLLIEWNQKINLTRVIEKEAVYLKHFYDSLTIAKIVDLNNYNTLLDFGTGAGFPGIVLKIFYPNLKITLLDSLQKRINFLNEVIAKLNLKEIETVHSRIEDYKEKKFDIITTRAVANLSKLLDYTYNIIDKNTIFIPLKAHIKEELIEATDQFKKYNLQLIRKEEFKLPIEQSVRNILEIKKK